MIRKVAVRLRNGVGIKQFGMPIRDKEIINLNTRQIFKLFTISRVQEIIEFDEKFEHCRKLNLENYKDENPDWSKEAKCDAVFGDAPEKEEETVVEVKEPDTEPEKGGDPISEDTKEPVVESAPTVNPVVSAPENVKPEISDDMTEEELEALIAAEEANKTKA